MKIRRAQRTSRRPERSWSARTRSADYVVDKADAGPDTLREIAAFIAASRSGDRRLIRTLDSAEIARLVSKGVFYIARFAATGKIVAMLHLRETAGGPWEFGTALVAEPHRAFGLPHCLGTICVLAPYLDPGLTRATQRLVEIEALVLPGNEPPMRVLRRLYFRAAGRRMVDTGTDSTLAHLAAPGTHEVELCVFRFDPASLGRIARRMVRYRDRGRLGGTVGRRADVARSERTVRVDVAYLQDPLMRLTRRVHSMRPLPALRPARRSAVLTRGRRGPTPGTRS